jgi:AcrR family transcriptional regulator
VNHEATIHTVWSCCPYTLCGKLTGVTARRDETDKNAAELRERILNALHELLADRTLEELSVADIIAAAGVSRASFYFYFAGKQAVLAELVRRAVGAGHDAAQPWVQAKAAPRETLRTGIDAGAGLWLSNAPVLRAIVESWASHPQLRELWLAQMATFTDAAVTRIEADRRADPAVAARLKGVDVPALAASLTWTGERLYYLAACGVQPFQDRTILVNTLVHLWESALYS